MTEWAPWAPFSWSVGLVPLPTTGFLLLAEDGTPIFLAEDSTPIMMANQYYE